MEAPIKISIVGYTNTIPFVYGLKHFFSDKEIDLQLDIPSVCAQKLQEGAVDIGLVPVAILKKNSSLSNAQSSPKIISSYCIGSGKKIDSVMLYSEVPLAEIKTILLDYQSRTSVELVKVLCRELWSISPEFSPAAAGYEKNIGGTTAAVIIGDRTFTLNGKYEFTYDLAEAWHELTGLPFVFACWVANKDLPENFLKKFDEALRYGAHHIPQSLENKQIEGLSPLEALFYLEKRVSYPFDSKKQEALKRFLEYLA